MGEVFYLPVHTALLPTGITSISLGAPLFCFLSQWMAQGQRLILRIAVLHGRMSVAKDEALFSQTVAPSCWPQCLSPVCQFLCHPVPLGFHYSMSSFQLITFVMRVVIWFFSPLGPLKRRSKTCPLKSLRPGISHPTSPSSFAPLLPPQSF